MPKLPKFVDKFYQLENDIFFNQLFNTGEAIFTYNHTVKSQVWNHAYPYNIKEDKDNLGYKNFIRDTITFYLSKSRTPTIYLDERYFASPLLELLYENHFERFDDEAWMRIKKINEQHIPDLDLQMVHIDHKSKLPDFLEVVQACFNQEYCIELTRDFNKIFGFKKIEHFCFYHRGTLIGAGSVYSDRETAHLHSISVLPKFQRHGFGSVELKMLFEYVTKELKIKDLVLQCDAFTVESFYRHVGAESFYRRYGYILNTKNEQ